MRKLTCRFYRAPADQLAPALIGAILVRRFEGIDYRARIVETEAYLGPHDLASHSSKGRTKRTEVMFGPAGRAYVYLIYGMHEMLNVVAGKTGDAHAVLIRAAEPLDGWVADLSGPGKLTRALHIDRSLNAIALDSEALYFKGPPARAPRIVITPRIGVDYAGEWKGAPLRYLDGDSLAVSRRVASRPVDPTGELFSAKSV